jgi:DNA-binding Xre family transcriptional regulator
MFYDRFMKICRERGLKPSVLLESLGLSRGNLYKWRNNAQTNAGIITALCRRLNVSADYLLCLTPDDSE